MELYIAMDRRKAAAVNENVLKLSAEEKQRRRR
jgi:hypothetical protein